MVKSRLEYDLEETRNKMLRKYSEKTNFKDFELYSLSKKLDKLIYEFMLQKSLE